MQAIDAGELRLEPLTAAHAEAMFEVLVDPEIHRYLDQPAPPSVEHLRGVYERLETRHSHDGRQRWLNWVIRAKDDSLLGYVQATVTESSSAWVAYVLSPRHWGHGHAGAAMRAMLEHLKAVYLVKRFFATVETGNGRSIRLLERLGFHEATNDELEGHRLSATERLYVH